MKTALITGCSSGFGLLTAATLAKNGFRTFATMRDLGKRGRLDAALAGAGTGNEVRLGGYAISVYWARQTLEALHGSKAENR